MLNSKQSRVVPIVDFVLQLENYSGSPISALTVYDKWHDGGKQAAAAVETK